MRARRARGISLLETVVAGVLAAGVFFTLIAAYPTAMMSLRRGHDMAVASTLAQKTLEEMRQTPFDTLPTGETTPEPVTVDGTQYQVETLVALAEPELKDLRVRVTWKSANRGDSGEDSFTLHTSVYRFRNP